MAETQGIRLNQIEKKGISKTFLYVIVPYEDVMAYRIESNRIEKYIN